MTEPDDLDDDGAEDYTIRSVTISERMPADGERYIAIGVEGDPAPWEVVGMLAYAAATYVREMLRTDNDFDPGE